MNKQEVRSQESEVRRKTTSMDARSAKVSGVVFRSRIEKVAVVFAALCCLLFAAAAPALAQTPSAGVRLQAAIAKEDVDGDLKSAIEMYQKIADDKSAPRDVRSRALLRLAGCYEKLGRQAQQVYQQVVRDFADQPAAAQARAKLAALRQATSGPATMTQRMIDLPFPDISGLVAHVVETDGRRQLSVDANTGTFMISDLAGKDKRMVFRPKAGEQIVGDAISRDLSVASISLQRGDGSLMRALVRSDGTGYREFEYGVLLPNGYPDWSWDNRYLFRCVPDPNGGGLLWRYSIADGEIRKVPMACGEWNRPSPDGRFIAISESRFNFGKVSVAPIQGGEPQLVSDNGRVIDWTRDGRYLILASARSGSEALYLFPMRDGRRSGESILVRYGSCRIGSVNTEGALICESTYPAAWLGTLDSSGRSVEWREWNPNGGSASWFFTAWSPDSSRIVYSVPSEQNGKWSVRLHNIASGEEREVYQGNIAPACAWPENAKLICTNIVGQPAFEVFSVSLDSGRVESLGTIPGSYGAPAFSSVDGQAVYIVRQPGWELIRWDLGTRQATSVDRLPGLEAPSVPNPSARWLARKGKETVEIRPMAGGQWRPLISLAVTMSAFTPDGNWLLFHDVDVAGKHGLFRVSTSGGPPERIADFPSVSPKEQSTLFVSPDGRKLLVYSLTSQQVWMLENFEPKQTAGRQ